MKRNKHARHLAPLSRVRLHNAEREREGFVHNATRGRNKQVQKKIFLWHTTKSWNLDKLSSLVIPVQECHFQIIILQIKKDVLSNYTRGRTLWDLKVLNSSRVDDEFMNYQQFLLNSIHVLRNFVTWILYNLNDHCVFVKFFKRVKEPLVIKSFPRQ